MHICVLLMFLVARTTATLEVTLQSSELFIYPLNTKTFNITIGEDDEFDYTASLAKLPDLPPWVSYIYSKELKSGFLYGTPSDYVTSLDLDIIAFHRETYNVFHTVLHVNVVPKQDVARRTLKLKIHNLNVEDVMEPSTQERILDVFKTTLWPESSKDLHFTELISALSVGDRRPANPNEREGILLTIGSRADFSESLGNLQREVSNLWHLRPCPRGFKKTSVERNFHSRKLMMDWCSFRLIPEDPTLVNVSTNQVYSEMPTTERTPSKIPRILDDDSVWRAPARWEVPQRSYAEDSVVAVFVPLIVMLVIVGFLTAILGVHPEGKEVIEGQLYEAVFEELPFFNKKTTSVKKVSAPTVNAPSNEGTLSSTYVGYPGLAPPAQAMTGSLQRGSPFLMSSAPGTPASTLTRSAATPRSTLRREGHGDGRSSTLGRPEPPPYTGTLRK